MNTYIIAECCNNFNGNMTTAKKMIDLAKEAGCDAAKFQMRLRPDRISPNQHAELKNHCDIMKIDWLCSVFDIEGAQIVEALNPRYHKIPSGEVGNLDLANVVTDFGKSVLVSLGMCGFREALNWVDEIDFRCRGGSECIPMQTTSIYPCPYSKVNLNWAELEFLPPWGLSCHTPTIYTALAAVAMGATFIEKHITFSKSQEGPDHSSSLNPSELFQLVEGIRAIELSMGREKIIFPEEMEKAKIHKFGMRTTAYSSANSIDDWTPEGGVCPEKI